MFWAELVLGISVSHNASSQCLGKMEQALVPGQVSRVWVRVSGVATRTLFVSPSCPSMTLSPCHGSVFQAVAVLTSLSSQKHLLSEGVPPASHRTSDEIWICNRSVNAETQPGKNTGIVTDLKLEWLRGRIRTYRSVTS